MDASHVSTYCAQTCLKRPFYAFLRICEICFHGRGHTQNVWTYEESDVKLYLGDLFICREYWRSGMLSKDIWTDNSFYYGTFFLFRSVVLSLDFLRKVYFHFINLFLPVEK